MGAKEEALAALETVIERHGLASTTVGRNMMGDPGFMKRFRNPKKTVSTDTLDTVWKFIHDKRRQLKLDLE